jgi:hypothetical protein
LDTVCIVKLLSSAEAFGGVSLHFIFAASASIGDSPWLLVRSLTNDWTQSVSILDDGRAAFSRPSGAAVVLTLISGSHPLLSMPLNISGSNAFTIMVEDKAMMIVPAPAVP